MSETSIRALLEDLQAADALLRLVKPVDPKRTLAALARQAWLQQRRATRFDLPFGHMGWRVASQLLVDRSQWARAFGIAEAELLFALRDRLAAPIAPVAAARAPVNAVRATTIDLGKLPVPLLCAEDAGPRLLAVALARDPASAPGNDRVLLGLATCRVVARDCAVIGGLPPGLRGAYARARAAGAALPIAIVAGAHPALYLAAALAQWRPDADLGLAGALRGAPIEVARLDGVEVPVPADAELAIGGVLPPDDAIDDGPNGDLLGLYGTESDVPVLHARAHYHRTAPVLYAPLTGAPPSDHAGMVALATELLVAQHIRHIEGGIDLLDVRCHAAAGALVLAVKLRPRVEGQSKTALVGALSGPASWPKLAIGVDEDVDAADLRDVFWSAASRTHAALDVGMVDGVPAHPNDVASPRDGDGATGARLATRWFIDSTMPPLTQPERRLGFARAIPRNLSDVSLGDFVPRL